MDVMYLMSTMGKTFVCPLNASNAICEITIKTACWHFTFYVYVYRT